MSQSKLPEVWQKRWQQEFSEATAIQKQVFEPLTAGDNLVGISPTGTGKTIAYLLPLLTKVVAGQGTQLLIVTSSQELAMQVTEVARIWGRDLELSVASVIGGANLKRQLEKLKNRPEIIVGTPGRLVELMDSRKLKAHQIKSCVMDEADQLLSQGAKPLLLRLLKHLNRDCQLSFFSATADQALSEIREISPAALKVIDVTETDESKGAIDHFYLIWPSRKKVDALRRILNQPDQRCLIFFNQLADLGAAEEKLLFHRLPVASLASDQGKTLRKQALTAFRDEKLAGLLSTDVAARGLDIEGLDLVVNADIPGDEAAYLHRSGRVGRMGRKGSVVTIIGEHQLKELRKTVKAADIQLNEIYLHGGRFQTTPPEKDVTQTTTVSKTKKTAKVTTGESSVLHTDAPKKVVKREKDRKRKQKNKGKRRS